MALIVGIGPTLIGVAQLVTVIVQARRSRRDHDQVRGMIRENTAISTGAFHEANTVNVKLEKLGLAHNETAATQTAALDRLTEKIEGKDR